MRKHFLYIAFALYATLIFAGCAKDNYAPPKSILNGKVTYNGQPLGLRSNAVQLELWQHGFANFTKIEVYVAQDGTFSSELFDGDYKLVRRIGNGPWADNTDSIDVSLHGTATVDVPVDPYFVVKNETYKVDGNTLTATFNIQKVNQSKGFDEVIMCLGKTTIVDRNNFDGLAWKTVNDISDLSQTITLTADIPASLIAKGYLYVRLAAKAAGADERVYTIPFKVTL